MLSEIRVALLLTTCLLLFGCRSENPVVPTPRATIASPAPTSIPSTYPPTRVEPTATAVPPTPTISPTSLPLTAEQELANLVAFARLHGLVRYFHPSDEAVQADWDQLAIDGVHWVYDAESPQDLAQRLEHFFQPIAPTVRVFPEGERPSAPAEVLPPDELATAQVVMWEHHTLENASLKFLGYESTRIQSPINKNEILDTNFHDPRQPYQASLGGGVEAVVPLALFLTAGGTFPHVASPITSERPSSSLHDEQARRLAGVIISWNVMQHFYPYFDVVDTDWLALLPEALSRTLATSDEAEYFQTLRWLIAQLDDGHGSVLSRTVALPSEVPPVFLTWAEGQIVVLYTEAEAVNQLELGSIVLTIDGRPAVELLAEAEALISGATIQWKRAVALERLLAGERGSQVTLEVQTPDGRSETITLERNRSYRSIRESRPETVAELEAGIIYVDLTRITNPELLEILPQLATAQGVIFDIRGDTGFVDIDLLGHLTSVPITSMLFSTPVITTPDWENVALEFEVGTIEPKEPFFTGHVAFLSDGRAVSFEETWLTYVQEYQLGNIVGEPSAGTNGGYNFVEIPGWYTIYWTANLALRHDGSQHHGLGVQPTVPVSRTIAGIAAGQDEVLDTAVAIIKQTNEE